MSAPRRRLVRSELTKLLTLRSVQVTAVLVVVVDVLAAWSQAAAIGRALRTDDPSLAPGTVPETVGLEWVALGLVGIIVFGVLAAGHEHTSGQHRTSLLAVPDRRRLFAAKTCALTVVVAAVGLLTVPAVSLVSQAGLGDLSVLHGGVPPQLVLRWVGAVGYWTAMALVSFALASLLRQTLVPLFTMVVVSQLSLLLLLASSWFAYLPTIAGVQLVDAGLVTGSSPAAALGTPLAAAVTAGWTVVLLAVAGHRFTHRPA